MGFLSVAVSVVFLIYLLLRISRMVGGTTTTVVSHQTIGVPPDWPHRSDAEIQALLASMPTEWVTYEGMTPPLQLKVRGLTQELFRRFVSAQHDNFGRDVLARLSTSEQIEVGKSLLPNVISLAYVVDWKGVAYPNGNPVPYTPDNLASLLRKDEMLTNFIDAQAERIGPAWENG
jgi:hypothetical protein